MRGTEWRFIQLSPPSIETEEDDEEEDAPPKPMGQGRRKLIPSRTPKIPGERNLKLHVVRMTEQQLEQVIKTINEDPTTTIADNNCNENQIIPK